MDALIVICKMQGFFTCKERAIHPNTWSHFTLHRIIMAVSNKRYYLFPSKLANCDERIVFKKEQRKRFWHYFLFHSIFGRGSIHGWFATSHARILEHRLEVCLYSCTIKKKGKLTKPSSSVKWILCERYPCPEF